MTKTHPDSPGSSSGNRSSQVESSTRTPEIKKAINRRTSKLTDAKRLAEQEKREAALALLRRTEQKKQDKLKKHLDDKIDKEVQLIRQESLKKKKERLNQLYLLEKERERATQEKLTLLQNASYDIYQRKVDLIRKLTEIEVKEQVNKIATELKRKPQCNTTHEQVKEVVKTKQRMWVAEKVETERHLVNDHFVNHFETFTRVPIEKEEEETKQQMEEYLQGSLESRRKAMEKSHEDAPKIYHSTMEAIVQQRQEEVTEHYNKKLHDNHLAKIQRLNHAKSVLQLSTDEIADLLECDVEAYETDIGIIDVENDKIRTLIANHEKNMKRNLTTFTRLSEQLKQQMDHDRNSLRATRTIIEGLEEKRRKITEEERRLFGDDLNPVSLTAIENRTNLLNQESVELEKKSEEIQDDLKTNIEPELERQQSIYTTSKQETDLEEEKARIRTERVELLREELELRTNAIEILKNRIKELKETTIQLRKDHSKFKKRTHIEQNKRLASIITNEDARVINNQLLQMISLELETKQNDNGHLMKKLATKLEHMKKLLQQKEVNESHLVETTAFLRTYLNEDNRIELPHLILTKYKEELDDIWDQWTNEIQNYAESHAEPDIARTIYNQKLRDLQARFAHSAYVRDERASTIGHRMENILVGSSSEAEEPWDTSNVEAQLDRLLAALELEWDLATQSTFKEQRLLSLIHFLRLNVGTLSKETESRISDSFRQDMDIFRTRSRAMSKLNLTNGTFSGGIGGIQYLVDERHQVPAPILHLVQEPRFHISRLPDVGESMTDENDENIDHETSSSAESTTDIDSSIRERDGCLDSIRTNTDYSANQCIVTTSDPYEMCANNINGEKIVQTDEDICQSDSRMIERVVSSGEETRVEFRQLFELLTREKINHLSERIRTLEETKIQEERKKLEGENKERDVLREDKLSQYEDIRGRIERYLNIQEATQQLNKRMAMVRKQKARNETLAKEADRIKKINAHDPTKTSHLYLEVNEMSFSEDPPTNSETPSDITSSTMSEFSDIVDAEERRRLEEENDRLWGLNKYDPRTMLERLKNERNFIPEEL